MAEPGGRARSFLRRVFFLGRNRISTAGAVITTASAVTMVGFWIVESMQTHPVHPYDGIVLFLILPFVFVLGLLLIPLGVLVQRRKLRARGELPQEYPKIDLQQPEWRHGLALVGLATVANVGILGAASYKGVEHMDSTQFCGVTCHSVMAPEYTAYTGSPHSRVDVRAVPHRARRRLVRQVEAVGRPPGVRGRLRHPLAPDPLAREGPAARARDLRAVPLAAEVPRRQAAGARRSTRTTRPTRRPRPCWC